VNLNATGEVEAIALLRSLNTLQMVYRMEQGQFASSFQDLSIEVPMETEDYSYRLVSPSSQSVLVLASAKRSDLKSFTSMVSMVDGNILSTICQTVQPSRVPPQNLEVSGLSIFCPEGATHIPS
jgi:hypothetical protein